MTKGEARFRRFEGARLHIDGALEGQSVRVYLANGERALGVIEVVGWRTGTYKVRIGRRKPHVSVSCVWPVVEVPA